MAKKATEEVLEVTLINNIPAVPDELDINGLKVSETLIKEKVSEALLIKIENFDDKANYEKAKEQRQLFVKFRTQSEKWRKAGVAPIQKFLTDLKTKTDLFGTEAKKGEDHLDKEIKKYEEWETAEKQRKAAEKLKKYNERIAKLAVIGGKVDENGVYHFDFDEVNTINTIQLNDFDDEEFEEVYLDLKNGFDLQVQQKADEDARLLREKNQVTLQAAANNEKRTKLRRKELFLHGFEETDNGSVKNGITLTEEDILSMEDEVWDLAIEKSEDDYVEENETPAAVEPVKHSYTSGGTGVGIQPSKSFGSIAQDFEDKEIIKELLTLELEFTSDKPFIEVGIGPTFTQRIFPEAWKEVSTADVEMNSIALSGKISDQMSFILIKK